MNSVHWWSGSTQALPATTVLLLLGAWVLVGFPLTVIGGIVGKNRAGSFHAPCRTRNIARQIPSQPWYKHTAVHMAIGGFLPFRWAFFSFCVAPDLGFERKFRGCILIDFCSFCQLNQLVHIAMFYFVQYFQVPVNILATILHIIMMN